MNLYLATCHCLALLEEPIKPEAFRKRVETQNPLFASECLSPQKFLLFLSEEGLLEKQISGLILSPLGQKLYQHVLNWTARNKDQVAASTAAFQAKTKEAPIEPNCPRCGQRFCALYVFVIILERLYAGLDYWNAWQPLEQEVLAVALNDVLFDPKTSSPSDPYFLLGETISLNDLLPSEQKLLREHLHTISERNDSGELSDDFYLKSKQALLLYHLPGLKVAFQRVPRLKLIHQIYSEAEWQVLQALAYPELKHFKGTGKLKQAAREKGLFLRTSRVAFNQRQTQALIFLKIGELAQLMQLNRVDQDWHIHRVELLTL